MRAESGVILRVAAQRLASIPLSLVTLEEIASDAGLPLTTVAEYFPSVRAVGAGILDHERESMRAAQEAAFAATSAPLARLILVFRAVGENLANDIVVRAGVRIAAESRHLFPERRLDPFLTWEKFVTAQLTEAHSRRVLRAGVDIPESVRIIVAAGMGTKELISFRDAWPEAPERFEGTMTAILGLLVQGRPKTHQLQEN